jgi:hypothetical protein
MVAGIIPATRTDRTAPGEMPGRPIGAVWLVRGSAGIAAAAAALTLASPALAANTVRITGLSDIAFGIITNLGSDTVRSQNVCIFSGTGTSGYNVRATGSGTGSAFTLANGGKTLAYETQWNSSSGQTSGTTLSSNVTRTGLTSTATNPNCASGPPTSASLIVVVRSAAASSATAGTYSGTLTLVFAPE